MLFTMHTTTKLLKTLLKFQLTNFILDRSVVKTFLHIFVSIAVNTFLLKLKTVWTEITRQPTVIDGINIGSTFQIYQNRKDLLILRQE